MALAALIKNTRTTRRHISLAELVQWLEVAITEVGGIRGVAERIGLSVQMLQQFLYFKDLVPAVQELFATRQLDSVDMVVHLRRMDCKDQEIVAVEAANGNLNSADIRAICEFLKQHPATTVRAAIDTVKATRNIKQYVVEFVVRGKKQTVDELKSAFESALGPESIVSLALAGSIGTLVLNQQGRTSLQRIARKCGYTHSEAIHKIVTRQQLT